MLKLFKLNLVKWVGKVVLDVREVYLIEIDKGIGRMFGRLGFIVRGYGLYVLVL